MDSARPSTERPPVRMVLVGFEHMHAGDQIAVVHGHPGAVLVGSWDTDAERMDTVCDDLGIPPADRYSDLDRLVEQTRPDVAIVCSSTSAHAEHVRFFAERDIHVLLEKPLASNLADARTIAATAAASSALVGVNWPLAWYPVHRTTHRLIGDGVIGDVLEIHYYDGNRGPLLHSHGKHETDPSVVAAVKAARWWYSAAAGGGSLRDYLGYGTTLATWFRDGELPIDVTARTHVQPGDEVDEQSVVIASYASGLSTLQTRWGTFTDPWTHQPQPRCGFVVVGTDGTLASWDYAGEVQVQDHDHPEGYAVPVDTLPLEDQTGIAHLVHALQLGEQLSGPASLETSMSGQLIVEAAIRSVDTGRAVRLDEL